MPRPPQVAQTGLAGLLGSRLELWAMVGTCCPSSVQRESPSDPEAFLKNR